MMFYLIFKFISTSFFIVVVVAVVVFNVVVVPFYLPNYLHVVCLAHLPHTGHTP